MCQPSQISWHQLLYLFCDKYKISTPVTLGSVEMSKAAGRVEEASFAFHGTVRLQPSDDSCLLVGVKRKTSSFCFLTGGSMPAFLSANANTLVVNLILASAAFILSYPLGLFLYYCSRAPDL